MKVFFFILFSFLTFHVSANHVHKHKQDASNAFNEISAILSKAKSLERGLVNYKYSLSKLEDEENKLQAEWGLAMNELRTGLYCRGCGQPKSIYEKKGRPDFHKHKRENNHNPPQLEKWTKEWNNYYRPQVEERKKKISQLKSDYKERNDLLWRTIELRDRKLYQAYKGTFNGIVGDFDSFFKRMKARIKLQEELIEQYDEILNLLPKEDPEFIDYLEMLADSTEEIYEIVEQTYDRQINSSKEIASQYETYTRFNETIQNLARQLNQDTDLGTTGEYIAGNFVMLPLGYLMIGDIPQRPSTYNNMVSTKTQRIIKSWSGKR